MGKKILSLLKLDQRDYDTKRLSINKKKGILRLEDNRQF